MLCSHYNRVKASQNVPKKLDTILAHNEKFLQLNVILCERTLKVGSIK